ncbi:zinc-ribbon domain-containing protein [Rhodoplanes sp. Z2-YC6860]|uniref:zinc-ribbon domain-containing protein n=1 Tax=Rhodoplanes sp. Z2-YC6860 TaxID=674703 RepID=UPI00078CA889|nr:zinc-ribbon domain-containing protein [Rhodoplanes sp. Z2-YC6860]AMN39665.1 Zinc finger/thioredoxin [Rhodoplanes sp. Z2-YC6860]
MQIACPKCSTAYQIAAQAIGASGRTVRCVRCQNVWYVPSPGIIPAAMEATASETADTVSHPASRQHVSPPESHRQPPPETSLRSRPPSADATPIAPTGDEASPEPDAGSPPDERIALSDISIPLTDAPPLAPEPGDGIEGAALDHTPEDIERVAERRRIRAAARRKNRRRMPLPFVIVFLLFVSGALIGLRKDIVRHVPQMASFYSKIGLPVNLRGLVFNDVKIGNETHDGVPVLVVEGVIASTVGIPVDVPRIRFSLRNPAGAEVYSWTAQPAQPVLEPGDTMPFRTRLASPPADGQDLQVRFFTKRDAAGSAP